LSTLINLAFGAKKKKKRVPGHRPAAKTRKKKGEMVVQYFFRSVFPGGKKGGVSKGGIEEKKGKEGHLHPSAMNAVTEKKRKGMKNQEKKKKEKKKKKKKTHRFFFFP